ncbi:Retrovirus-related Pol polyprotein from transposon TNT 1-94, partial [Araneus ventricosus]
MQMTLAVGEKESPVEGKGIIHFLVKDKDGKFSDIILKDVLYNPNLRRNLLSGGKLERLGINFVGSKGKIHVYDKNWNELFYALRKSDLYFLKPSKYITMSKVKNESVNLLANQVEKVNTSDLWHERFCHINNDYVLNTSKNNSVKGLPKLFGLTEDCISCKPAKSRRVSFKSMGQIRSKRPLELLHMDLCGPLPVLCQGGNIYFFMIVEDFSRKVTVFPIRNKSDAFQTFIRFQKRAERFLNRKVISVRTDGGLEFCNQEFEKFLEKLGIRHEKTNPYSPEMNGVAESFNLTALDGVKALLKSSGMSQKFWAEALLCFTYAWNRACHKNKKTPFELYSGRKPSVSHLKKFGCIAYVGVPKQTRKKLDMRAKLGIMCGYAQTTKGYRILLLEDQRVIETINVSGKNTESGKVTDLLNLNEANLLEVRIPRTYKEAIKVPEASKWEDAMNREVMHERNVWELIKPPKDAKTLDSDFAANRDDRVSIGGYILFLDETPISWGTFKQRC